MQEDVINGRKLEWYDYGARFYDPVIARFTTQDPMTDSHADYTPYHYTFNNPLRFIDPIGLDTVQVNSETPIKAGDQVELPDCTVTEPTPVDEQQLPEVTVTPKETDTQTESSEVKPTEAGSDASIIITGALIVEEILSSVPAAIGAFITSAALWGPLLAESVLIIPGDTPIDHDPLQYRPHRTNKNKAHWQDHTTTRSGGDPAKGRYGKNRNEKRGDNNKKYIPPQTPNKRPIK